MERAANQQQGNSGEDKKQAQQQQESSEMPVRGSVEALVQWAGEADADLLILSTKGKGGTVIYVPEENGLADGRYIRVEVKRGMNPLRE